VSKPPHLLVQTPPNRDRNLPIPFFSRFPPHFTSESFSVIQPRCSSVIQSAPLIPIIWKVLPDGFLLMALSLATPRLLLNAVTAFFCGQSAFSLSSVSPSPQRGRVRFKWGCAPGPRLKHRERTSFPFFLSVFPKAGLFFFSPYTTPPLANQYSLWSIFENPPFLVFFPSNVLPSQPDRTSRVPSLRWFFFP